MSLVLADTPPPPAALRGIPGTPRMGDLLELLRQGPEAFARRRVKRYHSLAFQAWLLKPVVVLLGAEAQEYVLSTAHDQFSARLAYDYALDLFGDGVLLHDGEEHRALRKAFAPMMTRSAYPAYVHRINTAMDATMAGWQMGQPVNLVPLFQAMALRFGLSLALDLEPGSPEYTTIQHLWQVYGRGFLDPVQRDLGLNPYGQALRARRSLHGLIAQLSKDHHPAQPDFLSLLLQSALSPEQIQGHLTFLLTASFDTTRGTLAWLLVELLRQPELLARCVAEAREGTSVPDEPVTLEAYQRGFPLIRQAIKETLRLHPVVPWLGRRALAPFTLAGQTFPAGIDIFLIPAYTQRMPEYFAEPDRFDPDRFGSERDEGRAHPAAWVGFGGVPHQCLGMGLADLAMQITVVRLLRATHLALVPDQRIRTRFLPANVPSRAWVRLFPRKGGDQ